MESLKQLNSADLHCQLALMIKKECDLIEKRNLKQCQLKSKLISTRLAMDRVDSNWKYFNRRSLSFACINIERPLSIFEKEIISLSTQYSNILYFLENSDSSVENDDECPITLPATSLGRLQQKVANISRFKVKIQLQTHLLNQICEKIGETELIKTSLANLNNDLEDFSRHLSLWENKRQELEKLKKEKLFIRIDLPCEKIEMQSLQIEFINQMKDASVPSNGDCQNDTHTKKQAQIQEKLAKLQDYVSKIEVKSVESTPVTFNTRNETVHLPQKPHIKKDEIAKSIPSQVQAKIQEKLSKLQNDVAKIDLSEIETSLRNFEQKRLEIENILDPRTDFKEKEKTSNTTLFEEDSIVNEQNSFRDSTNHLEMPPKKNYEGYMVNLSVFMMVLFLNAIQ